MAPTPEFDLVDSPKSFRYAADCLAGGRGPYAIDTERASTFRYDDRAFLVQVQRKDAGTFLISPEGHRDCVTEIFAPVISGAEWILHAASEDLPSLGELGLYPGSLFDTELAARIAGFERPNLAAMVSEFTGAVLEKSHGREDWSTTPLPVEWQIYAAYDVIYLNDLAEALAEFLDAAGKLEFAEQECAHLLSTFGAQKPPHRQAQAKTWRDAKGVSTLDTPTSLMIAKSLWEHRDAQARALDTAPNRILPTRALVDIARAEPRTPADLARATSVMRRRRDEVSHWFEIISAARHTPVSQWPHKIRRKDLNMPSKSSWQRHHPESWNTLVAIKADVAELATALIMSTETLLQPAILRQVVWEATVSKTIWDTGSAHSRLRTHGARPWQAEITAPLLASKLAS